MTSSHKEMNVGVELLLKRMETHPEEFSGVGTDGSKWFGLITKYRDHFDKEDIDALDAGIDKIMQQQFTEKVLEGLVDPKPSTSLKDLLHTKLQNATPSAGVTLGAYSNTAVATIKSSNATGNWGASTLTIGNQTLDQETIEHMKAHLDWLKREEQLKKQKEHKTIFGRLHDYFGNL